MFGLRSLSMKVQIDSKYLGKEKHLFDNDESFQ